MADYSAKKMLLYLVVAMLQVQLMSSSIFTGAASDRELMMSFVVNRHGERTPDADEISLSDQKEKLLNLSRIEGLEGLTNIGKRRAYQIGKFIRQRYGSQGYGLLSDLYLQDEIALRSTDKERTKMTAQVAMSALYPPVVEQQWDESLGKVWQPVPYTAVPLSEDYLRYYTNCQRFKDLMTRAKAEAARNEFQQFNDLAALLKTRTGADFTENPIMYETLFDLFKSQTAMIPLLHKDPFSYVGEGVELNPPRCSASDWQTILTAKSNDHCQVSLGLDIPEWAKPLLPKLGEAARLAYRLFFKYEEMKKIGGGVILNDFVQAATDISQGKSVKKRFRMYSAHDFNIGSLMEVTKVIRHEQNNPEYGSLFGLELYRSKTSGEFTVMPIYLPRAGESTLQMLHFTGCETDSHCDLDKFKQNTQEYLLPEKEYYKICNIRTEL